MSSPLAAGTLTALLEPSQLGSSGRGCAVRHHCPVSADFSLPNVAVFWEDLYGAVGLGTLPPGSPLLCPVYSHGLDVQSHRTKEQPCGSPRVSEVGSGEKRRPPNHTGRPCSQNGRAAALDHAARREGTSREMLHQGFPRTAVTWVVMSAVQLLKPNVQVLAFGHKWGACLFKTPELPEPLYHVQAP